jgi:hypothetical protein
MESPLVYLHQDTSFEIAEHTRRLMTLSSVISTREGSGLSPVCHGVLSLADSRCGAELGSASAAPLLSPGGCVCFDSGVDISCAVASFIIRSADLDDSECSDCARVERGDKTYDARAATPDLSPPLFDGLPGLGTSASAVRGRMEAGEAGRIGMGCCRVRVWSWSGSTVTVLCDQTFSSGDSKRFKQ